jgi:hypothetical protein
VTKRDARAIESIGKKIRPENDVDVKVNHGNTKDGDKNIGDNTKSTRSAIHNVSSRLNPDAMGEKCS